MAKVLAIETAAYGQSSGWRKGEDLIDALPYIDTLPPELKQQVDALIEEELKKSTKKPADYLREMPPMPTTAFEGHPMLANEFERQVSDLVKQNGCCLHICYYYIGMCLLLCNLWKRHEYE
jgi:pre-mRNA-splicing factor SPF27